MTFVVKTEKDATPDRCQAREVLMNHEAALGLHDCVMERECDE